MQEKLWVVIQQDCNGIASVLAFDFESDAQNFAQEMTAMRMLVLAQTLRM